MRNPETAQSAKRSKPDAQEVRDGCNQIDGVSRGVGMEFARGRRCASSEKQNLGFDAAVVTFPVRAFTTRK